MASGGIQFFGMDAVIDAYLNMKVPAFSISQGKAFLMKYDGNSPGESFVEPSLADGQQILTSYLDALYEGSTAIYTLKVYEDLPAGGKIKPSTEHSGSCNFRLSDPGEYMGRAGYSGTGRGRGIEGELKKLSDKFLEIEERLNGTDLDEEPETIGRIVLGLLKEPEKLERIVNVTRGLMGMPVRNFGYPPPAMGNVYRPDSSFTDRSGATGCQSAAASFMDGDNLLRLEKALDILGAADPKIIDHLETLARVAQGNPEKFRSIVSMITLL